MVVVVVVRKNDGRIGAVVVSRRVAVDVVRRDDWRGDRRGCE